MPTRTATDHQAVLDAYERLQNGKAVARELGLHENTVYKIVRISKRLCARCQSPTSAGQKHCQKCAEHLRTSMREKRKARRTAGLCTMCDEPLQPPSTAYCEKHRLTNIDRQSRYNQKPKRGTRHAGVTTSYQRMRALVRYGQHAIDLWVEMEGRCEVCGRSHEELSVQVHHIDENDQNGARENLALLCFHCHRTVHMLLAAPERRKLLAWYESQYPL